MDVCQMGKVCCYYYFNTIACFTAGGDWYGSQFTHYLLRALCIITKYYTNVFNYSEGVFGYCQEPRMYKGTFSKSVVIFNNMYMYS